MSTGRKVLGVSRELHSKVNELSRDLGLPMTVVLDTLLEQSEEVDWDAIRVDHENSKPNWSNIRRIVNEYREKNPEVKDEELAKLTGFSISQVETITHTAHRRCIRYMKEHPQAKARGISKNCNVSERFAERIYKQFHEGAKIPRSERYLFKGRKKDV